MARKKITISEDTAARLETLMGSREFATMGECADLVIRVGANRLEALDRHKTKKSPAPKAKAAKKKTTKKKTTKKKK